MCIVWDSIIQDVHGAFGSHTPPRLTLLSSSKHTYQVMSISVTAINQDDIVRTRSVDFLRAWLRSAITRISPLMNEKYTFLSLPVPSYRLQGYWAYRLSLLLCASKTDRSISEHMCVVCTALRLFHSSNCTTHFLFIAHPCAQELSLDLSYVLQNSLPSGCYWCYMWIPTVCVIHITCRSGMTDLRDWFRIWWIPCYAFTHDRKWIIVFLPMFFSGDAVAHVCTMYLWSATLQIGTAFSQALQDLLRGSHCWSVYRLLGLLEQ